VAATATSRSAAARAPARAPSRAPAPRRRAASRSSARRAGARPTTGRLVPVAVGRTAGAVGGIADCGAIVRLTRGQLWIGALAALLVGIVALNVSALRFNAASGEASRQLEELAQQNSALRGELATALSRGEVLRAAKGLGLVLPPPGELRYREPKSSDAAEAAQRLRDGELTAESAPALPVPVTDPAAAAPTDPAVAAPTEPAVTDPAAGELVPAPAPALTPATQTPAATPPAPAAPAGGGVAPQ